MPAEAAYTGHVLTRANGPIMNPRTPEVGLPVVAEMQAEVARLGWRSPACPSEPSQVCEVMESREPGKPRACDEPRAESFLFDDPYWDDAFDSYHNPTLRTCCGS